MIPPKTLTAEESEKLTGYFIEKASFSGANWKDKRNLCMYNLMLYAGLRVGEVVKLLKSDLAYNGEPVLNLVIRRGVSKGHRERTVPMADICKKSIEVLIADVWCHVVVSQTAFAFEGQKHNGHITTRQVERILNHATGKTLGVDVNPHKLRHTFATRLMQRTSMRVVQQLLGHKYLSSTQIYTHPNADDLRKAIEDAGIDTAEELEHYRQEKSPHR